MHSAESATRTASFSVPDLRIDSSDPCQRNHRPSGPCKGRSTWGSLFSLQEQDPLLGLSACLGLPAAVGQSLDRGALHTGRLLCPLCLSASETRGSKMQSTRPGVDTAPAWILAWPMERLAWEQIRQRLGQRGPTAVSRAGLQPNFCSGRLSDSGFRAQALRAAAVVTT